MMKRKRFTCQRNEFTIHGHAWGEGCHAVILSHGFLANERMCYPYAKLLSEMGYLAITYDFCGGGIIVRSEGRSQDMTVWTEAEDLKAVIAAVREQYDVQDISLLGCSQGGFVSGLVASELDRQISNLILFYPAICIPDDARNGQMMFYRFDPANIPDLLGRFPMKLGGNYARTVINMDPFKELSGYHGRTLLVHGTKDPIVNIEYSRRFKDVYPNCVYHEIEGAGHGFKGKYDKEARRMLKRFMEGSA